MTVVDALLDLDVLDRHTFGDAALAREVLLLYQAQAQRLLPELGTQPHDRQTDTVHLLTGSSQGIGAQRAVVRLQAFEAAPPTERAHLLPSLIRTFDALEVVIAAYLAAP